MPDPPDPTEREARDALDELAEVLNRIPGAQKLGNDVRELRSLVVDRRPPRVAVIGRRGAGKSSLANALLGAPVLETGPVADTTREPRWLELDHQGRRLRWLDTPGLRAGDAPARRDQVRDALAAEPPDVVLLASKATQVDAGIDEDAAEVAWLLGVQRDVGLAPPGVVGVVTKVDELAPVAMRSPPYEGEKRANIDRACAVLRKHLERCGVAPSAVVPVGTYQRFFKDGTLAIDWRWNLDALGEAMLAVLPMAAQFDAARAFDGARVLRRRIARRIVGAATSVSFAVGALPIPVAELAILTPLRTAMVTSLILLSGRSANARSVSEWLASLGVNVGAGLALRSLLKLTGVGAPVAGAIAASGTWALGASATRYFIEGSSLDAARKAFEDARREGPPRALGAGTEGGDGGPAGGAPPPPRPEGS